MVEFVGEHLDSTHVFHRIRALRAGTLSCFSCACCSAALFDADTLTLCLSLMISDRKVIGHSCQSVPLKIPWYAFHIVQRYKHLHLVDAEIQSWKEVKFQRKGRMEKKLRVTGKEFI